jgi:tetratricopeptide (TPR) repeat protein
MRQIAAPLLALVLPAAAAAAEDACAPLPDDGMRRDALHADLARAPNEAIARSVNARLWALWTTAPDAHAQELLDSGISRMRMGDLDAAISAFGALIAYCPAYAEGWNQRAFARFLAGDDAGALADLDAALARVPRHVGALSGKALTLIRLDREAEALVVLEKAVALHPFLAERALLPRLRRELGDREI